MRHAVTPGADEQVPVTRAFDRGAARYDRMVALNPGYHRHLAFAARTLGRRCRSDAPMRILDLACGSGASTRALVDALPAGARVLGLDASAGMLAEAERKVWPAGVSFEQAECGRLDVQRHGPGEWDGVLAAYLFRNVDERRRDRAIREAFELLRPGGRLVVQEYSIAGDRLATAVWDAVSWLVIIPLGIILDRNPGLYRYLWRSVRAFDSRARFAARLRRAGFTHVDSRSGSGWQRGILHTFVARKPVNR
ncbi:class I SAM-dependent methyltransferase [Pseudactinotalea sp. HY158]|uniref:class I SAM-dependent methyltransferase n=1 Tax=Pseudactinotalea sp. HY158 TaxID=2654547 RepID=UPI00129C7C56|nr:class I SAM-dependent methyltransferase [Pseudactinotalea sp. HY158]QGH70200.1 methyltransferase domain-containing protein [Pseudactinotalea sp. HY158]